MNGETASGLIAHLSLEGKDFAYYEGEHHAHHAQLNNHKAVVCSECGAVYQQDRWTWNIRPVDSCEMLCPACLRVQNRVPAGILTVRGDCLKEHKDEILRLIRSKVKQVGEVHPLKRMMDMEDDDKEAVFAFTDAQLTREIGDALHQAYDGVLDFRYSGDSRTLRVIWQR